MDLTSDEVCPKETPAEVRREVLLDNDPDEVRSALVEDDLLSAWLGPWESDGEIAHVRTDDGVRRAVRDRRERADGLSWTWHPDDDPDATSEVRFVVSPDGGGTRLTILETWTGAPLTAPARTVARSRSMSAHWTATTLALGAVLCGAGMQRV